MKVNWARMGMGIAANLLVFLPWEDTIYNALLLCTAFLLIGFSFERK